jgi:hypothetical protein
MSISFGSSRAPEKSILSVGFLVSRHSITRRELLETAKSRHLRITVFFDYLDYFLGTDIAISTNLTLCNKCEHS